MRGRVRWRDWVVLLGLIALCILLLNLVSCSSYQRRNSCVRKYLDYYTSGGTKGVDESLGSSGLKGSKKETTTGYNPDVLWNTDRAKSFERIAAMCLLDDDELVRYVFETEYQQEEVE